MAWHAQSTFPAKTNARLNAKTERKMLQNIEK